MDPMGIMGLMGWNDGVLWGLMGLNIYIYISGWWFQPTPLRNMSLSVGMILPNIWKNKKNVPNHQPDIGSTWFNQLKIGITQGITAWWWLIPQKGTPSRGGLEELHDETDLLKVGLGGKQQEGSNIFSEDGFFQYGISQTLVQTQNDQYNIATLFPVDESRKNLPDRLQLHHGLTRHDYV